VLRLGRRLSVVFLALALVASHGGVCAGWVPTREARMACCSGHDPCPMHASDSPDDGSKRVVSQAEADRCCALSDRDDSMPSPSTFAFIAAGLVLGPVPVLVFEPEARPDLWRAFVPIPAGSIAKHLLLSVLIV
jgi:hypothetical protein